MMKKLHAIIVILLATYATGFAQTQMNNWYVAPRKINMTVPTPAPAIITPALGPATAATALHVANGFYDNAGTGNLLFYIADGAVYDYNNTLIGNINTAGAEIAIVPFGDNGPCQNKYNIFSTSGGVNSPVALWQSVLDMNSYTLTTTSSPFAMQYGSEFGAIAVGKPFGAALDRHLYFMAGSGMVGTPYGQIYKAVIHHNGSLSSPVLLYPNPALGVTNPNAGGEVFSKELELSPDGKWLAWSSYAKGNMGPGLPTQNRYHFLALNTNGDLDIATYGTVNVYQQFNIPGAIFNLNNTGFRGVEFDKSGRKLFMGAGADGIFSTDIAIPFTNSFTFVNGSSGSTTSSFGFSQIELANNSYMYASAGGTFNNIGAFDPTVGSPVIYSTSPSFTLTNPPFDLYSLGGTNPNSTLYTLPDQIDGQDYNLITSSGPPVVTTWNAYTCSSSTVWQYGNGLNPWNTTTPVHIIDNITITPGTHLTISNMTFRFSTNARVIIQPGATLTLYNSTLTSASDKDQCPNQIKTWKGVQVLGNSTLNQTAGNQGKLNHLNNSVIEFAECGACRGAGPSSGGIIVSNNAGFSDNQIAINLYPYQNFQTLINGSKVMLADKSNINLTRFSSSPFYPFANAPIQLRSDNNQGLYVEQSDFINSNTSSSITLNGIGIWSHNSLITVNNSNFSNLKFGFKGTRDAKNRTSRILNSIFNNNQTAIYLGNVNYPIIVGNTFTIGDYATNQIHTGLHLNSCSGYRVEENTFTGTASTSTKIGCQVTNSGSADNEVFKNSFSGFSIGNLANGVNRSGILPAISGLQYSCNLNSNNLINDFSIQNKVQNDHGIKTNQGSTNYPAGNTFTQAPGITHIRNKTTGTINYYHKNNTAETPSNIINTVTFPTNAINNCPSGSINPGLRLSILEIAVLDSELTYYRQEWDNLFFNYNQLLDGGNTGLIQLQIQYAWSDEAVALYNDLLSLSPFLSEEVLRDLGSSNALPQALFVNLLLNNPDATKNTDFIKFLEFEIPNPIPSHIVTIIEASWENITLRTSIESTLSQFNKELANRTYILLADHFRSESPREDELTNLDTTRTNFPVDEVLANTQSFISKIDLIEQFLYKNMPEQTDSVLNSINENLLLSEDDLTNLAAYNWYFNYRKSLADLNLKLDSLTQDKLQELINFRDAGTTFSNSLADNVLCFYYQNCQSTTLNLNEEGDLQRRFIKSSGQEIGNILKVTPNPVRSQATIDYSLNFPYPNTELVVTDLAGRVLLTKAILLSSDQINLPLHKLQPGLYQISLNCNNKIISSCKFIKQD